MACYKDIFFALMICTIFLSQYLLKTPPQPS